MLVSWHCCCLQDIRCMREGERDSGGARTVRRLMYYAVCISMVIHEYSSSNSSSSCGSGITCAYLSMIHAHTHPSVRSNGRAIKQHAAYSSSNCCIRALRTLYVVRIFLLYIYIRKLHWHSDNSPLLTASACCLFLSFSLHFAFSA